MIKEISRRCDIGEAGGGPFSTITAVVSDMLIDDGGEKKYLTCCWVDEVPEGFSFEVSGIELFPFYLDYAYECDEYTVDDAKKSVTDCCTTDGEAYEGVYQEYFRTLEKMVKYKIVEEGLFDYDEDDYDDEEDEE